MSNLKNLELILDGVRQELLGIRKILERQENEKSMILQKVDNENNNAKLF